MTLVSFSASVEDLSMRRDCFLCSRNTSAFLFPSCLFIQFGREYHVRRSILPPFLLSDGSSALLRVLTPFAVPKKEAKCGAEDLARSGRALDNRGRGVGSGRA